MSDELTKRLAKIDLNTLVTFLALINNGSVKDAAKSLDRSMAYVSKDIAKLEKQLCIPPLFVKGKGGMIPTPRAQGLAGTVRQMLEIMDDTISMKGQFQHSTSNHRFRIAATQYSDLLVMPRVIDSCLTRAPNISFDVTQISSFENHDRSFENLSSGELDLVIHESNQEITFLSNKVLCSDHWVWIASQNVDLDDLEKAKKTYHPIFINGSSAHKMFENENPERSRVTLTGAIDVVLHIASIANSLGCVPSLIAQMYAPPYQLTISEPDLTLPKIETSVYSHKRLEGTAERQWLLKLVADNFRDILSA